ncbi:MAG: methionine adenosyltransferase [Candidatus Diapherotrites archaeon]|nr:methionine adenosyltransferase [Candidatus Diapherotrites archaeon]
MRNITIEHYQRPVTDQKIEIVERKGTGHPDQICDSIMDKVSVALCKEYLKKCGRIMHHNVDKGLLSSGSVKVQFGGGKVEEPMLFIFGDRATYECDGETIPVDEIAINTAKEWLHENIRFLDPEHVRYQVELKPGSAELTDIFNRQDNGVLGANDTSAGVGYAPLTPTERVALETEKFINSKKFKEEFPEAGEDVKVMAMRQNNDLLVTIALAFVDRFVKDEADYFRKKSEITERVMEFVKENHGNDFSSADVNINTLDVKGRGIHGVYLTVTGTSLEDADSGQVGRGNRTNGIIAFNRPSTMEAAAGKNPVSHVGKIYNVLAHKIANKVVENVDDVGEVYIWLLSQIGNPIDQPAIAAAQVALKDGVSLSSVEKDVFHEVDDELANIDKFTMKLARGEIPIS